MSAGPVSQYHFLPWARRGLAATIQSPDSLSGSLPPRAQLAIDLTLHGTQGGSVVATSDATVSAQLRGPGDVVGIDTRHIVRTEPKDGTANFEPNYLAAIEFDEPDLPWLHTPGAPNANGQLMPWLALIVLADGEYAGPSAGPFLPAIQVHDPSVLPPLSEYWAWAHVQVSGPMPTSLANALTSTPGVALARLICPRELSPGTGYTAFLVPAFDAGRLAGLGQPPSSSTTLAPAWGAVTPKELQLPVYFRFAFHTSDLGDFESLVRRLQPLVLSANIGLRAMDVSQLDPTGAIPPVRPSPLDLEGAMMAPSASPPTWPTTTPDPFQSELAKELDLTSSPVYDPTLPDPKVLPPFYGHWYVGGTQVTPGDGSWLSSLNLDPRYRTAAGFGIRVVLQDIRALMASAWSQFASISTANQLYNQGQLARGVLNSVFDENLVVMSPEALTVTTAAVHARILGSPRTVAATLRASRLPTLTLSWAFRRVFRPLGPIRRRQPQNRSAPPYAVVAQLAQGTLTTQPPHPPDQGTSSVDSTSDEYDPGSGSKGIVALLRTMWWLWPLIGLVLLGLLILLGFFMSAALLSLASGVVAAVAGVLAGLATLPASHRAAVAGAMRSGAFTAQAINAVPGRPSFHISLPVGAPVSPVPVPAPAGVGVAGDAPDAAAFRLVALQATEVLATRPSLPTLGPPPDLSALRTTILACLNPPLTVTNRLRSIVQLDPSIVRLSPDPLAQIMAAPSFPQPMYVPLANWDQSLLLPGVGEIPHESVSLLAENRRFIESYMVGLNDEMGRELLWHGFPTDQRGTYFRQFWDVSGYVPPPVTDADREPLYDITAISTWGTDTALTSHDPRGGTNKPTLVLLLRGELLRRYPNTQIYAAPAMSGTNPGDPELVLDPSGPEKTPIYQGELSPDLRFFGFNLTADQASGKSDPDHPLGWFFVFQQIPGEPRFGLEPPDPSGKPQPIPTWAELSWGNFALPAAVPFASPNVIPSNVSLDGSVPLDKKNSWIPTSSPADFAYITMRSPQRVAILAKEMLPDTTTPTTDIARGLGLMRGGLQPAPATGGVTKP